MSIEVNLLPWREIRRNREKQKLTHFVLGGLMLLALVCFLANSYSFRLIDRQTVVNQRIGQEIALLNEKIKKISKIKKQKRILIRQLIDLQALQNSRLLMVHLLDELVRLVPEDIDLSLLRGTKKRIILEGLSLSNDAVSRLIQGIEHNPWMRSPSLIEIKKDKFLTGTNRFSLSFVLRSQQ